MSSYTKTPKGAKMSRFIHILPTVPFLLFFVLLSVQGVSSAETSAPHSSGQAQLKAQFSQEMRQLQERHKAEAEQLHAKHRAERQVLLEKYKAQGISTDAGPGAKRGDRSGHKPPWAENGQRPEHPRDARPHKPPHVGEGKSKGHGGGPPPKDWKGE
ncbi:MAG: hypothetical protein V3V45_01350 [Candidatus Brocadiales bacterium]